MPQTAGKRVVDRIVSFHQTQICPIIRGKGAGKYEFRIKAYVALVDSYVFADISEKEVRLKRASRKKDPISRNTIELTIDFAEKKKS